MQSVCCASAPFSKSTSLQLRLVLLGSFLSDDALRSPRGGTLMRHQRCTRAGPDGRALFRIGKQRAERACEIRG
jgi:hypothetical protein